MAFSALKAVDAEGRRRKGTKQNSTSLELSLELVQMLALCKCAIHYPKLAKGSM